MQHNYDTLSAATNDLKQRGYIHDFNLQSDCIHCKTLKLKLKPEAFEITEMYRFEGMSNPSDSAVVYAIASNDGIKGLLVDAYGTYADSLSEAMIEKLRFKP